MRVRRLLQIRYAGTRGDEGAAGIDLLNEIVAAHVDLLGRREIDRRGVVDADVDAAELLRALAYRRSDARLVTHVHRQRQRLAAGTLDVLGGAVDGASELRMRRGGLGGDRDIRSLPRRPQRNGQADSAAGTGNKQ